MIIEFNALNIPPRQVVIDTKDIYLDSMDLDAAPNYIVCLVSHDRHWIVTEETFAYLRAFMLNGGEVNMDDDDESELRKKEPVLNCSGATARYPLNYPGHRLETNGERRARIDAMPAVYRVEDSLNVHPYMLKNVRLMSDDVLEQYEAWNKSVTAKGGNKTIWTKP